MTCYEMWKTLWTTRDKRQMCRIQAYKHYPCPRVGYPALGAGHARKTDGFVHRISKSIAPTQFLAANLYADVIKCADLQHQVSFHDLVAPVVRLTPDTRCRRGRSRTRTKSARTEHIFFSRSSMQSLTILVTSALDPSA